MASSESEYDDSDTESIDSEDGSDADGMCEFDDGDDGSDQQVDDKYAALSKADIRRLMEDDLDQVSSILSLSRSWSSILLRIYSWNVYRACESWLAGKDRILEALGQLAPAAAAEIPDSDELYCGICLENCPSVTMSASACSHYFCDECWKGYISVSIADGAGCLLLRCPQPSCPVLIHPDMIDSLASEDQKEKYSNYLVRSYVEQGKKSIKWCPSPDCEYAVQFDACRGGFGKAADVRCNCSYSFCWNCTEEAHRPVDCATVANWISKNTSEAENTNWIMANTKLCPKCRKPIEKNQGCMHMTCRRPCRHEFCWTCLGDWKEHGDYSCNRYSNRNGKRGAIEGDKIREMAKLLIEKYSHYYERWAANHKSRRIALESMSALRVDDLREKLGENAIQMEFINSAWLQIVECRSVLKWTYAFGYYLPEDDPAKKRFFEYLQGEAEAGLERLHGCAEKELERFIDAEYAAPSEEFREFKEKLTGLTTVTKTYFDNLVRALEGGLMDVDSISCDQDLF